MRITGAYLEIASTETVWANFEADVISPVCDDFKKLVEQLRKRFCTLYSAQINRLTRSYFRQLAKVTDEPVGVHAEFAKICKLVLEANSAQKQYQLNQQANQKLAKQQTLN